MASNLAPNSAAAENIVFDTVGGNDEIFPTQIRRRALQRAALELRANSTLTDASATQPTPEDGSATQRGQESPSETDVLKFPSIQQAAVAKRAESFLPLQEWEGYVTHVHADSFVAVLRDVTAGAAVEEEEAEFPCEDISEGDRTLLREGAIFRCVVAIKQKGARADAYQRLSSETFRGGRMPISIMLSGTQSIWPGRSSGCSLQR